MSTTIAINKTDFIKFNVSPEFKKLVSERARSYGLTISELGRMLFGWYAHGLVSNDEKDILKLAREAKENYSKGKVRTFKNAKQAVKYLESL